MARPIASVIVAMKNGTPYLEGCIASLAAQKTRIPFEVHLVDAGSADKSYSLARRLAKKQRNFFVWKEKRPGTPAARNHGARKARGDILLFTDVDCRHDRNWLDLMARPLLKPSHYPLVAVGGVTDNPLGAKGNLWERYLQDLLDFWERDRQSENPAFLPWASTTNLAVRAEIFRALKGFDERWRTVADDVDFCWRLVLSGFVIGQTRARLETTMRRSLRALLRQMESHAYYHQSLLTTYQRELKLPRLSAQTEKLFIQSRRFLSLIRSTTNLSQAGYRGIDSLVLLASLKGALEAKMKRARPDPKLSPARKGITPKALAGQLSRGYHHLHSHGWCYWKSPSEVGSAGELILFRPRYGERHRLSEESWKIWEVKAERGQSEDAAALLGRDPEDETVLKNIDHLTLNLHTRRLLP
jgi:glycosyltransferase involved in cell wall biosynthesis